MYKKANEYKSKEQRRARVLQWEICVNINHVRKQMKALHNYIHMHMYVHKTYRTLQKNKTWISKKRKHQTKKESKASQM